jgi:hypothetical protein
VKSANNDLVQNLLQAAGIASDGAGKIPQRVWNRGGRYSGQIIKANARVCACGGKRVSVRWPDGKITYPCRDAIRTRPDGDWQIC